MSAKRGELHRRSRCAADDVHQRLDRRRSAEEKGEHVGHHLLVPASPDLGDVFRDTLVDHPRTDDLGQKVPHAEIGLQIVGHLVQHARQCPNIFEPVLWQHDQRKRVWVATQPADRDAAAVSQRAKPALRVAERKQSRRWFRRSHSDVEILVTVCADAIDGSESLAELRKSLHEKIEVKIPDSLDVYYARRDGLFAYQDPAKTFLGWFAAGISNRRVRPTANAR